ncbi:hypothetical protein [Salinibaculum salinum]|uniref:hypothetical protein n=1 Tax=Salinibaculum salinum TaxID=3131996 RepID=UPI0030EDF2F3
MAVWTGVKYTVVLLLVGSGSLCFVAADNLKSDIPQGDYRYEVTGLNETEVPSRIAEQIETETPSRVTESTETKTPYASEPTSQVLQFSNLSSSTQAIFLTTLDSGGTYSTDTHAHDFLLNSDTSRRNYVRYQNSTYQLKVHNVETSRAVDQLVFGITVVAGAGLTGLGGGALLWWNRKSLRKRLGR